MVVCKGRCLGGLGAHEKQNFFGRERAELEHIFQILLLGEINSKGFSTYGMERRVAGGSEDMAGVRNNNFHSPQLLRLGNSVQDVGGRPGSTNTAAGSSGQAPGISSMPSPPPPYTAVTDVSFFNPLQERA